MPGLNAIKRTARLGGKKQMLRDRIEMIEIELGLNPGELDPIEGLARIAASKTTPLDVKVDCLKSIAPYLYPKLATVAVRGDEDGPPIKVETVNIERFLLDPSLVAAAQQVALAMEEEAAIQAGNKPLALPAPMEVEFVEAEEG